jgi:hypothetical protein
MGVELASMHVVLGEFSSREITRLTWSHSTVRLTIALDHMASRRGHSSESLVIYIARSEIVEPAPGSAMFPGDVCGRALTSA